MRNKKLSVAAKKAWERPEVRKHHRAAAIKAWNEGRRKVTPVMLKSIREAAADPKRNKAISRGLKKAWSKANTRKRYLKGIRTAHSKPSVRATLKKSHYKYQYKTERKLKVAGWSVIKSGWPDFICLKGNKIRFIEAKAKGSKLSNSQKVVMDIFQRLGLTIEVMEEEKLG